MLQGDYYCYTFSSFNQSDLIMVVTFFFSPVDDSFNYGANLTGCGHVVLLINP